MEEFNEGSTGYVTVSFFDGAGASAVPASLSYRIDDVPSGTEIRGDTSLAPAASVEITLTPTDNQILDDTRIGEVRAITVTATYGATDAVNSAYQYRVLNLRFLP